MPATEPSGTDRVTSHKPVNAVDVVYMGIEEMVTTKPGEIIPKF